MTRLEAITANAFRLPALATANEAHIARAMRMHELSDGHRRIMPKTPDRSEIEREGLQRVSDVAVLRFLRACPDNISTQRDLQEALAGEIRPASIQNALRNLSGPAGFIRKHVNTTGNRNWYELTDKGRNA